MFQGQTLLYSSGYCALFPDCIAFALQLNTAFRLVETPELAKSALYLVVPRILRSDALHSRFHSLSGQFSVCSRRKLICALVAVIISIIQKNTFRVPLLLHSQSYVVRVLFFYDTGGTGVVYIRVLYTNS